PGLTTVHADEREQLLAFLANQRYVLRLAAHGLTDDQARLAPSASALSVGGLIKHVAATEAYWVDVVMQRQAPFEPGAAAEYEDGFRLVGDDTLRSVLDRYDEVAAETERVVRSLPLDHPVPVPEGVPWFPSDVEAWTLRWVVLHIIEETARHAGHADIVRESVDGGTWFALMAAAEGSGPAPWIEPWQPA
ncbi:MAG TPA: DinB family protein, partial [Acidimicrobiales bacterium]|nr:DinB family protein [Acidimicrobiales bacterium]